MKLDLSLCGLRAISSLYLFSVFCFSVFALTAALHNCSTAAPLLPQHRKTATPQHHLASNLSLPRARG
jgi:hypothetical protein